MRDGSLSAKTPITTSLFELFKIGPGPSSSHTIGPMKAALRFREAARALPEGARRAARRIEVRLFGSLSATGRGHGTDRALAAGLMGVTPEDCPSGYLDSLLQSEEPLEVDLGGAVVPFRRSDIVFDRLQHEHPYSNTLTLTLTGKSTPLMSRVYYSIGGGFVTSPDEPEEARGEPLHPYADAGDLRERLTELRIGVDRLMLDNEQAVTGIGLEYIHRRLDAILDTMDNAVERGLRAEGVLPGPIGLRRKAAVLMERARHMPGPADRFLLRLNAYALAVSEENAAGHVVVTAPTSGAAGLIPGVAHAMSREMGLPRDRIRTGLLAAAAVGFVSKHNAGIAGAEMGCQGEIGVASAMAAAMLAVAHGHPWTIAANAAEIALEHHLGLTCDPVGGYVQIPCVERNAMGAVKAYNAFLLASRERPAAHKVDLDAVIRAMRDTGRDMSSKYKETSLGGLAVSLAEC